MHKHTIPLIDGAVSFRRRLGWRASTLTAIGLPLCMRSLGLSWVTSLLRRLMPCPEKRPDRGLTLELAAQCVVVLRTTRNAPPKKLPVAGAQPNGARLSC